MQKVRDRSGYGSVSKARISLSDMMQQRKEKEDREEKKRKKRMVWKDLFCIDECIYIYVLKLS